MNVCKQYAYKVSDQWAFIYIYIYIEGWVQVTPGVTLSDITPLNIF